MKQPKVMALAIIRQDDRIFVSERYDPETGEITYCPFGAPVAFGERGEETVTRQLRSALGVDVATVRFLGAMETLLDDPGCRQHQLALVYEADIADETVYMHQSMRRAVWQFLDTFEQGDAELCPAGLLGLLQSDSAVRAHTLFGTSSDDRRGRLQGIV